MSLLKFFLYSRVFYFLFIWATFYFLDRFDSSNLLVEKRPEKGLNKVLAAFLKNFYSYDAVHFIGLVKEGYNNDKSFAFFPLFPLALKYFAKPFQLLFAFENVEFAYILAGIWLSCVFCYSNGVLINK